MAFRAGAALAVALLAAPGGAHAERPPAHARADGRPFLWQGALTGESPAPPAEIARRFATEVSPGDGARLGPAVEHRVGAGTLVLLEREYRGLRVLDGQLAVRTDGEGRVRWATANAGPIPANLSTEPLVSEDELPALLGASPLATELVVDAAGAAPRLAYSVTLPYSPREQTQWLVVVDAETGRVLRRASLMKEAGKAYAFAASPATSSEDLVQLSGLDGSGTITGHRASVTSCVVPCSIGEPSCRFCQAEPRALADGAGDFTSYRYSGGLDRSGAYAEIQAYHHVSETHNLAGWLLPSASRPQLEIMVNVRTEREVCGRTDSCEKVDCRREVEPFANARASKNMLVFGQGETVDYAYDGTVVSHEYGHSWLFTQGFVGAESVGQHGAVLDGAALHEAYADLFAAFRYGSGRSGEYVAAEVGGDLVRDLNTFRKCPEELYSPHSDSLIFSGAVWEVFRDISSAADRRTFAASVLAVPMTLGWSVTFEDAARLTLAEVEASLGETMAARLEQAFARRGVFSCHERLRFGAGPHPFSLASARLGGALPASYQIRFELASRTEELLVMASNGFEDACDLFGLEALIRRDEPVSFSAWPAIADAKASFQATGDGRGIVRLEGPWEPGTYHIALSYWGPRVELQIEVGAGEDCASCDWIGPAEEQAGGCGATPGSAPGGGGAILLLALGLLLRRRSSGGRPGPSWRPAPVDDPTV